jgi:phosphopentomutase
VQRKEGVRLIGGKVVLVVLDGVGVGALPDAGLYGDEGSNTVAHTAEAVGGLQLPVLAGLGLGNISTIRGVDAAEKPKSFYGRMAQKSRGKDSTTGHWELAGLVLRHEFPTYPQGFPADLMQRFLSVTGCKGYLGNKTASGTAIIQELGAEHMRTGYPIVYTSADSVFQIAAHEEIIPLEELYRICRQTREEVCTGEASVGRVIARPFVGSVGAFSRTTNRKDFSVDPPASTLLDLLASNGVETVGVGKVDDLFAHRGLVRSRHTRTNAEGMDELVERSGEMRRGLIIANLGDFDTLYGHRNDPRGFAAALQSFDTQLPHLLETVGTGDLLILTADHGNDPVARSTDHSREYVPLLCVVGGRETGGALGTRSTFADVAATIAGYFRVRNSLAGTSFLSQLYGEAAMAE